MNPRHGPRWWMLLPWHNVLLPTTKSKNQAPMWLDGPCIHPTYRKDPLQTSGRSTLNAPVSKQFLILPVHIPYRGTATNIGREDWWIFQILLYQRLPHQHRSIISLLDYMEETLHLILDCLDFQITQREYKTALLWLQLLTGIRQSTKRAC